MIYIGTTPPFAVTVLLRGVVDKYGTVAVKRNDNGKHLNVYPSQLREAA